MQLFNLVNVYIVHLHLRFVRFSDISSQWTFGQISTESDMINCVKEIRNPFKGGNSFQIVFVPLWKKEQGAISFLIE